MVRLNCCCVTLRCNWVVDVVGLRMLGRIVVLIVRLDCGCCWAGLWMLLDMVVVGLRCNCC